VVSGKREAHLGSARASKDDTGVTSVGAENVGLAHQNDCGGAANKLRDTVIISPICTSSEGVGVAVLVLDLNQAFSTCGL